MRKSLFYNLLTWLLLIIGLVFLAKLAPILYSPEYILSDDFGHFWASGKLFIDHENPYNLERLISTQVQAGAAQSSRTSIGSQTLNPPWALLIFAPFSFLDYSLARVIWLIISITLLVISVRQFWQILHGSENKIGVALLVAFCFTPMYSVLSKGQITPWVVLGITGIMLYFEGKLNAWWAGIAIGLIATKPQLFYLLWPALGIWVISQRRWKLVFTGAAIGIIAVSATMLVNGQIFSQYITAIQEYPYDQWATPTIGSYLRLFWLGVDKFWVQYFPACLGLGWLVFHYWKNRENWVWRDQIPVMTLISLLTSPYAWTYDAIIILPAVLIVTSWLISQNKPIKITFWAVYLLLNLGNLLLHTQLSDFWFIWLAPSFSLWYLAVSYIHQRQMKNDS
jgi:hypothetical protein